jgi:hypothetical protein
VFCIGAHKTGTTSLESALTILGLRVCPTEMWWQDPVLQDEFYRGRHSLVFDLVARFDGFRDSPFNHSDFYEVLCRHHPDARFILTVRNTDHWIASRKRWRAFLIANVLPRDRQLEAAGRLFFEHEYGQRDHLNIDEQSERTIYEARNTAVVDHFNTHDRPLLILDLENESHPWQRLCGFLGTQVPDASFPHSNRTK